MSTAVEFLAKKGHKISQDPNFKLSDEEYLLLAKEFNKDMAIKLESERLSQERQSKEKAEIYLKPEEVSQAIGKGGLNIKLASMLTGYTLDVFRDIEESEHEEDIYLDEFADEIDQWVIDALKAIGCDTAKSVLAVPREDLIRRTDFEEETIDEVLSILTSEFED